MIAAALNLVLLRHWFTMKSHATPFRHTSWRDSPVYRLRSVFERYPKLLRPEQCSRDGLVLLPPAHASSYSKAISSIHPPPCAHINSLSHLLLVATDSRPAKLPQKGIFPIAVELGPQEHQDQMGAYSNCPRHWLPRRLPIVSHPTKGKAHRGRCEQGPSK